MEYPNKFASVTLLTIAAVLVILSVSLYALNKFNYLNLSLSPTLSTPALPDTPEQLFNNGDFVALNAMLDEKLLTSPSDISLLLQKAQALAQEASLTFREKELGDQALIYIDQALSLDPKSVEALTLKGYVYEIQEDYVKAHAYYDEALSINPNSVDTLAQKAHAYDLQGKLDEAEKLYLLAIQSPDVTPEILLKYSRILQMRGKPEEAANILIDNVDKIQNGRIKAETYFMLGQNLQTDDYNKQSEDYFKKSNETDPTFPMAYVGLAQESFKKSFAETNPQEKSSLIDSSFAYLKQATTLNPNQSLAFFELARQLVALGQIDQAKLVLKNLPEIIANDITLSFGDKEFIKDLTSSFAEAI